MMPFHADSPPRPPPRPSTDTSKFAMNVTLTRISDPADCRRLSITNSEPITIGRASRAPEKQPQPTLNNARYHSMVVSRSHAKLQAHPWNAFNDQVTVTDLKSTHGTWVNGKKIAPGYPMVLRPGDTIRFGEDVVGGSHNYNHRAPTVVFQRVGKDQNEDEPTRCYVHTSRFAVPSDVDSSSEADPSDFASSDDDNEEDIVISSVNTTPEKVKVKIGSQESPIDLDRKNNCVTLVIDLDENEILSQPHQSGPQATSKHSPKAAIVVIPEEPIDVGSQDEGALIVEDSMDSTNQIRHLAADITKFDAEIAGGVIGNNFATFAATEDRHHPKDAATDDNAEQNQEVRNESDYDFEDNDQDEVSDYGESAGLPLPRAFPSQELGYAPSSVRPRYDPVRESPDGVHQFYNSKISSLGPYYNNASARYLYNVGYSAPPPLNSPYTSSAHDCWNTSMQMRLPQQEWTGTQNTTCQPVETSWERDNANFMDDSCLGVVEPTNVPSHSASADQTLSAKPTADPVHLGSTAAWPDPNATRDKISISSIVNEHASAPFADIEGAVTGSVHAKSGTKRTAEELADTTSATGDVNKSPLEATVSGQRPTKRLKTQDRRAPSKIGRFVNNATYMVLGAVSVYAFLETPLAERLLESLGA